MLRVLGSIDQICFSKQILSWLPGAKVVNFTLDPPESGYCFWCCSLPKLRKDSLAQFQRLLGLVCPSCAFDDFSLGSWGYAQSFLQLLSRKVSFFCRATSFALQWSWLLYWQLRCSLNLQGLLEHQKAFEWSGCADSAAYARYLQDPISLTQRS